MYFSLYTCKKYDQLSMYMFSLCNRCDYPSTFALRKYIPLKMKWDLKTGEILLWENTLYFTSKADPNIGRWQTRLVSAELFPWKYSRLSLSRNRRDHHKHFEISVLRHIRFVILREKQFEQPNFTNDYVI